MTHEWILVANASRALCFEREQGAADLKLLDEFADPLGRAKGMDLESDRAGYESTRVGAAAILRHVRTAGPRSTTASRAGWLNT